MNNEKINSKIKLSNNSSFVILIFVILKFEIVVVPNFDLHPIKHFFVTLQFLKKMNFFFRIQHGGTICGVQPQFARRSGTQCWKTSDTANIYFLHGKFSFSFTHKFTKF